MVKTKSHTSNKVPIRISAYLSWRELLQLLKNHKDKVILQIPSEITSTEFTPEEETVLLKSMGLYTDEFIKHNEQVKRNSKKNVATCVSVEELRESLTK